MWPTMQGPHAFDVDSATCQKCHCSAHSRDAESAVAKRFMCCWGTLWHNKVDATRMMHCATGCPAAAYEALGNNTLSISTVSRAMALLTGRRVKFLASGMISCLLGQL